MMRRLLFLASLSLGVTVNQGFITSAPNLPAKLPLASSASGQTVSNDKLVLTVAGIMQDPATWIGAWPQNAYWTEKGDALYFNWNPAGQFAADSLFRVDPETMEAVQVAPLDRRQLAPLERRASPNFPADRRLSRSPC